MPQDIWKYDSFTWVCVCQDRKDSWALSTFYSVYVNREEDILAIKTFPNMHV